MVVNWNQRGRNHHQASWKHTRVFNCLNAFQKKVVYNAIVTVWFFTSARRSRWVFVFEGTKATINFGSGNEASFMNLHTQTNDWKNNSWCYRFFERCRFRNDALLWNCEIEQFPCQWVTCLDGNSRFLIVVWHDLDEYNAASTICVWREPNFAEIFHGSFDSWIKTRIGVWKVKTSRAVLEVLRLVYGWRNQSRHSGVRSGCSFHNVMEIADRRFFALFALPVLFSWIIGNVPFSDCCVTRFGRVQRCADDLCLTRTNLRGNFSRIFRFVDQN